RDELLVHQLLHAIRYRIASGIGGGESRDDLAQVERLLEACDLLEDTGRGVAFGGRFLSFYGGEGNGGAEQSETGGKGNHVRHIGRGWRAGLDSSIGRSLAVQRVDLGDARSVATTAEGCTEERFHDRESEAGADEP